MWTHPQLLLSGNAFVHEQIDHHESERISMERALKKLDAMVSAAMTVDMAPSAPERLAADLEVAAAAKQALKILRGVQVEAYIQVHAVHLQVPRMAEEGSSRLYRLLHHTEGHPLRSHLAVIGFCGMQAKEASKSLPHGQEE